MRIIGAGLPRTGTLTQKVALEMLGAGPCYHMVNVLADLEQVPLWRRALDGDFAWPNLFAGYASTVDWPGGFFYRELMDVYPDAKVLLSVRDPDRWARSIRSTIWSVYHGTSLMRHLSAARMTIDAGWLAYNELLQELLWRNGAPLADAVDGDLAKLAAAIRRHEAEVRATVPAARLVVWQPTDGWEPLCDLAGVPVPDVALPNVNDSAEFEDRVIAQCLAALNAHWDQRAAAH